MWVSNTWTICQYIVNRTDLSNVILVKSTRSIKNDIATTHCLFIENYFPLISEIECFSSYRLLYIIQAIRSAQCRYVQVGTYDPFSDEPQLGVQKIILCCATETLFVGGTAGQVVVLHFEHEEKEVDIKVLFLFILSSASFPVSHADGSRVSIAIIRVCVCVCMCVIWFVCLSVCPHYENKTAETTITKLATGKVR